MFAVAVVREALADVVAVDVVAVAVVVVVVAAAAAVVVARLLGLTAAAVRGVIEDEFVGAGAAENA